MNEVNPGQRLTVTDKNGTTLGLGTYLWGSEILLDKGTKTNLQHCTCEPAAPSGVPPFDIALKADARVFEGDRDLHNTGYYLNKGELITIEEVALRDWNHGKYVAGKFHYRGYEYWLIMSEVELPIEPHLHLVA